MDDQLPLSELVQRFLRKSRNRTWCEQNHAAVQEMLKQLTEAHFEDKLATELVEEISVAIQRDWDVMKEWIPYNIVTNDLPSNSLLLATASPLLKERIRSEKSLNLSIDAKHFAYLHEGIHQGKIETLWKSEKEEILALLEEAKDLELPNIIKQCEEVLARYINNTNYDEMLTLSLTQGFDQLKKAVFDFLNNRELGARVYGSVAMEFTEFQSHSLGLFKRLSSTLTHLKFKKDLPGSNHFNQVINSAPHLVGVDLSNTDHYSDRLTLLPETLRELNLSQCNWLSDTRLKILLERCPNIEHLQVADTTQLGDASWAIIHRLPHLKKLNISGCTQIQDPSLGLILRACRSLQYLNVRGCKEVSDRGFYDIAYTCKNLRKLNVSLCNLSDAPLVEIATRCEKIETILCKGCANLSLKVPATLKRLAPKVNIVQ